MRKQQPSQPLSSENTQDAHNISAGITDDSAAETISATPTHQIDEPAEQHKNRQQRPAHNQVRAGLAVLAGRTAGAVSRRLHIGGGTSIAGVVAQRIYPDIIGHLASELKHGSVMITGTNGKTTTSSFIADILSDSGLRVWRNREGSNLTRGIAASLIIRAEPNGHLRRAGQAISILEVDEAALPQLVPMIPPRVVVFTNLFRDQLDRYGEVDAITARWQKAIAQMPEDAILVLNADDPAIAQLGDNFKGRILYYGVNQLSNAFHQDSAEGHQVIDTRVCSTCGGEFVYDTRFYSHMGHYRCLGCGKVRPTPTIEATHVEADGFDRLRMQVSLNGDSHEIVIPLPGLYNIYNALAAITAAYALKVAWEAIASGIEQFKPVFGRGESIDIEGKTLRLLLAKNPTGFNEVLRTLITGQAPEHLLIVLNDNIADGKDISWIWDVDFERLSGQSGTIFVSGTRAYDLALRLKYAGVAEQQIRIIPSNALRAIKAQEKEERRREKNAGARQKDALQNAAQERSSKQVYGLANALANALNETPQGETLFVVPTYTGLLEIHHELEQRGFTARYWEGKDA
jgi:UDP-N-acetylmuramyl tripeptide synthase